MSRGHNRERAVKRLLEMDGWLVVRAAASLGIADLVALKAEHKPRVLEVKSTTDGPYKNFGPADRAALKDAAEKAGADAFLIWWPPYRDQQWIGPSDWPGGERDAA